MGTTIFLIFYLAFIVMMGVFVVSAGERDGIYEMTYAKQIALIINKAKPETVILIEVGDVVSRRDNSDDIFYLNKAENLVEVKLNNGYSYPYFSGYDVELKLDKNWLSVIVK